MTTFLKENALVIFLLLLMTALAFWGEPARDLFRYDVNQIDAGQWWRFLSANLVHTNWFHWGLNAVGIVLIWWIFRLQLTQSKWLIFFVILAPTHLMLLYWFAPELKWYVGFSGVLHGWLAAAAIFDIRCKYWVGYLLFFGLWGKVIWEYFYGSATGVEQLINAHVATEAHFSGVIMGTFIGLLWPTFWIRIDKMQSQHLHPERTG